MSDYYWEHQKLPPKMGLRTTLFKQAYDSRLLTDGEVLARESCQNSRDAGQNIKDLTKVTFKEVVLKNKDKTELLKLCNIDEDFVNRFKNVADKRDEKFFLDFQKFINNNELKLLIISDKNTCGLGGQWDGEGQDDHFGRLILNLGVNDKANENDLSGGSHGMGKTVYSRVSSIETTFFYSCFKETDTTDGANRRLMGLGIYPNYTLGNNKFSGFSFFGKEKEGEAVPLINDDAEGMAKMLKIERPKNELGTDVIILEPSVSLTDIRESVEKYWWPGLIKGDIHVEFIDSNDNLTYPSPKERNDLKPFIECYKYVKNDKVFSEGEKEVFRFGPTQSKKTGIISLIKCDDEFDNKYKIAVTRKTGMIINYFELGTELYPPAIGYFEADNDIHKYLISSENPSHSAWESNSKRLNTEYPEIGKKIVESVNTRLKNRIIEFQKKLVGRIITQPSSQGLLSRLLGKCLSGSKGGGVPPGDSAPRPCSLSVTQKSRTNDKLIYSIKLNHNENTPEEDFDLIIKPSLWMVGDFSLTSIKTSKEFIVKDKLMNIIKKGNSIELVEKFSIGTNLHYTIEIENVGDAPYRLICNCDANLPK